MSADGAVLLKADTIGTAAGVPLAPATITDADATWPPEQSPVHTSSTLHAQELAQLAHSCLSEGTAQVWLHAMTRQRRQQGLTCRGPSLELRPVPIQGDAHDCERPDCAEEVDEGMHQVGLWVVQQARMVRQLHQPWAQQE